MAAPGDPHGPGAVSCPGVVPTANNGPRQVHRGPLRSGPPGDRRHTAGEPVWSVPVMPVAKPCCASSVPLADSLAGDFGPVTCTVARSSVRSDGGAQREHKESVEGALAMKPLRIWPKTGATGCGASPRSSPDSRELGCAGRAQSWCVLIVGGGAARARTAAGGMSPAASRPPRLARPKGAPLTTKSQIPQSMRAKACLPSADVRLMSVG